MSIRRDELRPYEGLSSERTETPPYLPLDNESILCYYLDG